MRLADIKKRLEDMPEPRSAWRRGVKVCALELVGNCIEGCGVDEVSDSEVLRKLLLCGADDWKEFSYGGCSLIYDSDIAERFCTPSELKKRRGGLWRPSRDEEWLDVQTRALCQAERLILKVFRESSG